MGGGDSSSGEEDGDEQWKANILSIAATTTYGSTAIGKSITNVSTQGAESDGEYDCRPQKPKHYQIKAQQLLDDMLEKALEMTRDDPIRVQEEQETKNEVGVRLFKHAPVGIVFDHVDKLQGPKKRPTILPGIGIDEKSKKFKKQLKSIAVDGMDILAAAKDASLKALAKLEAKEEAAKAKAKIEEERVAELKKVRGERWLPSMAKEMQLNKSTKK